MCPEQVHPLFKTMSQQAGLGLPAAIFLLVVLALLAAAISELNALSGQTSVLQIQSQRAYFAAESALQAAAGHLHPAGQPVQQCTAVPATVIYHVDGLRGCSASLSCREDNLMTVRVFTLESIATCGSGADQALRGAQMRLP
jgi:MSHA biogenesis protein MshP